MKKYIGSTIAAVVTLGSAVLLAGCSTPTLSSSDGSRAKLYASVATLTSDSALVVAGTVTAQKTASDITPDTPFTLSTVTLQAVPKTDTAHTLGSTVVVRQIGSGDQAGPATILTPGQTYLLYLTPSGLSGELASQFYITGGSAGLYQSSNGSGSAGKAPAALGSTASFTKVQNDEGDTLPAQISITNAKG